jgi:prolyl oligopeptidase
VANDGPLFYLRTNRDAPKYKAVTVDISKPIEFKDFISESDGFLSDISAVNEGKNFAIIYKRNVCIRGLYSPQLPAPLTPKTGQG